MPTTCSDIVTHAATRAKIIRPGGTLKASEADDGMLQLQALYDQWVIGGMFGTFDAVYKTAAYTAFENEAVTTLGSPAITMPTLLALDGSEGTDRAPKDLACVQIFDTTAGTYVAKVYDLFQWVTLTGLALADTAPLALRSANGLADCLAMYWVESFGQEPPPNVRRGAQAFMRALSFKLASDPREVEYY